jgi:hypothetical protein
MSVRDAARNWPEKGSVCVLNAEPSSFEVGLIFTDATPRTAPRPRQSRHLLARPADDAAGRDGEARWRAGRVIGGYFDLDLPTISPHSARYCHPVELVKRRRGR